MKKKFRYTILSFCLIFLLFSCDGSLNNFLDKFNGNLFLDTGMVKIDTTINTVFENEKVGETYNEETGDKTRKLGTGASQITILTNNKDKDAKTGSVTIGSEEGKKVVIKIEGNDSKYIDHIATGFTPPMTDAGYNQFTQEMADNLASPKKAEAYIEHLREPVAETKKKEAKGTFALTAVVAKQAAENVSDESLKNVLQSVADLADGALESKTLTQSDVLKAQLIVSIVTDATKIDNNTGADNTEVQKSIVNKASTLLQLSKQEAGNFDIASVIDLKSLLSGMKDSSSEGEPNPSSATRSLDGAPQAEDGNTTKELKSTHLEDTTELKIYIPHIRNILVKLFGYNTSTQKFDTATFQRTLSTFKQMEIANRLIVTNTPANAALAEKYKTTSLTDYMLSFVIYQLDEIDKEFSRNGKSLQGELEAFIKLNQWLFDDSKLTKKINIYYPESFKSFSEFGKKDPLLDSAIKSNIKIDFEKHEITLNNATLLKQAAAIDRVLHLDKFKTFNEIKFEDILNGMFKPNKKGENK